MSEQKQCCARVHADYGCGFRACPNKAKVEVDGKHYCGVHDPSKEKARAEKRNIKWELDQMLSKVSALKFTTERTLAAIGRAVVNGDDPGELVAGYRAKQAELEEYVKTVEDYKNANNL